MSRLSFIYNGVLSWNSGILIGVQKLAGLRTTKVDLQGRFVTPGFIDSHVHFIHGGLQVSIEGDSRSGRLLHASAAQSWLRREDVQHAHDIFDWHLKQTWQLTAVTIRLCCNLSEKFVEGLSSSMNTFTPSSAYTPLMLK